MVGRVSGSARMSSIQAKLVLSIMWVEGVCCPVHRTERDGVQTVVVAWWLLNVTPLARRRSLLGNVTPAGKAKVLDFGLAKAFAQETPDLDASESPTVTAEMTRAGTIMGTAAYMSPEQARGHPVDLRSDVWAFGCVLFETLTAERALPTSSNAARFPR